MGRQGPRKLWKGIAALVGATVVGLVAAELLFRWLGPTAYAPARMVSSDGLELPLSEIVHYMRHSVDGDRIAGGPRGNIQANLHFKTAYDRPYWDYFDEQGCISIDTNGLGFRDLEFPVEKPDGELRILAVGDSFTYGPSVQLEDSWPQVLEQMLREEHNRDVEVINGGFAAGHWPPDYVEWIESDGVEFQPDLVIVGLCLNDMGTGIPMLAYPIAQPEPWLWGASRLLSYAQRELEQRRLMAEPRDFGEIVRNNPAEWEATQAALVQIKENLNARHIGFVVAVFPMISLLGDNYPYLSLHAMVEQFCAENGISRVDLLSHFRGRDERELWAHPTDQHPNDVGNELIAAGIRDYLEREELLK